MAALCCGLSTQKLRIAVYSLEDLVSQILHWLHSLPAIENNHSSQQGGLSTVPIWMIRHAQSHSNADLPTTGGLSELIKMYSDRFQTTSRLDCDFSLSQNSIDCLTAD
jgi:hypothetical protein